MDIQYIITVVVLLASTVYIIIKVMEYLKEYPKILDLPITTMLSFITSLAVLSEIRRLNTIIVVYVLVVTSVSLLIQLVLLLRLVNPKLWHKLFDRSKIYQERKEK